MGKTHLLRAWSAFAGAAYLARGPLPDSETRMLAVDDVADLDAEDQRRLFSHLNRAREEGGRLLVAGPVPPVQLALRPDLQTRLAQGLVFRLHPLSDRDKAQAVGIRAEARGMHMSEELVRYMLGHCARDLPRLLATVDALDALSLSRKCMASLALLKELLHGTTPQP